ncbi:MAG: hypothetical protein ACTHLR_00585 [Rhizomicrobium sp.]
MQRNLRSGALLEKREDVAHDDLQERDRSRDDPKYDQKQAAQVNIVRTIRFVDQCHRSSLRILTIRYA